jgi:itaconate CoA-transferase
MGQQATYDFLDNNAATQSGPVDCVNDPRVIAQNDNVISINATLQINLSGGLQLRCAVGAVDKSPPKRPSSVSSAAKAPRVRL